MTGLLLLLTLCGTSPENTERAASLHAWNARRGQVAANGAATPVRYDNGVFIVSADASVAVNDHPMDLGGRTLKARRLDAERFEVTNVPLEARLPGPLLATLVRGPAGWHYRKVDLTGFAFPLGSAQHTSLYISAFGGIYFAPPPEPPKSQYTTAVSAVVAPVPLVAPVLMGESTRWSATDVHVSQSPDLAVVTWKFRSNLVSDPVPIRFAGEVQAVLHKSGDVEFSYLSFVRFLGGAAVITTGAEPLRQQRQSLFTAPDAAGDANVYPPSDVPDYYDVRSVEVSRIGGIDLLEVRIDVGREIKPAEMPADSFGNVMVFAVGFQTPGGGYQFINCQIRRNEVTLRYPDNQRADNSLSYSGSSIRLLIPQTYLPAGAYEMFVLTNDGQTRSRDTFEASGVAIPAAPRSLQSDVSVAAAISTPLVETFTVPMLDVYAVWDALAANGLSAEEVEGVAIYTTFPTDIDYWAAAFSTAGNAGADGVSGASSSKFPRRPALMHMNMAGFYGALLHEMGHRWLFSAQLMDGGVKRYFNGADGSHAPAALETTAAFTDGSSPMGGQRMSPHASGGVTIECGTTRGFSWLELYLMGLAAPAEVVPFIELSSASSAGCPYLTSVPNKMVTVQQVIDAMGVRNPSFATSPKTFPVAFVLVEGAAGAPPETVNALRASAFEFQKTFSNATGARGRITIATPPQPPRRRSVRH